MGWQIFWSKKAKGSKQACKEKCLLWIEISKTRLLKQEGNNYSLETCSNSFYYQVKTQWDDG